MLGLFPTARTQNRIDPSHEIVLEPADEVHRFDVVFLQRKVKLGRIDGRRFG